MTEHVNVTDPNNHEPKGASIAVADTVYISDGAGSGSWSNIDTVLDLGIQIASRTTNLSTANHIPTPNDTALQVTFDSLVSTDDMDITAAGVATIKIKGTYLFEAIGRVGRTTSVGVSHILLRYKINGTPAGFTVAESLDSGDFSVPYRATAVIELDVGDTVMGEVLTDSSGINNGGLIAFTPVLVGWQPVPSAAVTFSRLVVGTIT